MKFFIILSLLLLPSTDALASSSLLTCEDFEFLSGGLEKVEDLDQITRVEILREFIKGTDPKCFS